MRRILPGLLSLIASSVGALGRRVFALTDGADPMYSRGIPIVFKSATVEGLDLVGRPLQTGWIVTAEK